MTCLEVRMSVVAGMLALGVSCASAQPNDWCNNSTSIVLPSTTSGTNAGATTSSGMTGCNIGADVWYSFSAPYTGTAQATTCPTLGGTASFDTVITVWSWYPQISCSPGSGLIACNDDACIYNTSTVSFPMVYNRYYFIAVGGYLGATGTFTLALTGTPGVPPNDHCAGAVPISVGSPIAQDNVGATTGPDPTGSCGSMMKDVWFSFTAPTCSTFTATTCGNAAFDTQIAVWQGPCGALTPVACNDDNCSSYTLNSTVSFAGLAGNIYFISVGGYSGASGGFVLQVTAAPAPPMTLAFFNNGPGTIGYTVIHGPANGAAFTAVSTTAGAYPNGWLHGIDIQISDLVSEWVTGYPFVVPLAGPCNSATVGPFSGLPSGLPAYAVTIGLPAGGSTMPTGFSAPASATVP